MHVHVYSIIMAHVRILIILYYVITLLLCPGCDAGSTSSVPGPVSPLPSTNAGPSWLSAPPSMALGPLSLSEGIGDDPDINPEPDQDGYYDFRVSTCIIVRTIVL